MLPPIKACNNIMQNVPLNFEIFENEMIAVSIAYSQTATADGTSKLSINHSVFFPIFFSFP